MTTTHTSLVSVIIPAFNAERFISEALVSVFNQTYRHFEVIVVDDGSTDRTQEIVSAFAGIQYFYQPNKGPAAARNTGLRSARGKYLAFLDADDFWHPDFLNSCVRILDTNEGVGAVHAKWVSTTADGVIKSDHSGWQPWIGDIFERLLVDIALVTPSLLWRRTWLDKLGGFDETPEINDDWLNWLRMAYYGCLFDCVDTTLVFVRKHERNLTVVESERIINWRFRALDQILKECQVSQDVRNKAYATTHWIAVIDALTRREYGKAGSHFLEAIRLEPAILDRSATYFALAHAHCGGFYQKQFDFLTAEDDIRFLLSGIFSSSYSSEVVPIDKQKAWSRALFCLGHIAYGNTSETSTIARHYWWQGLREYPSSLFQTDMLQWSLMLTLGRPRVKTISRIWRSFRKLNPSQR